MAIEDLFNEKTIIYLRQSSRAILNSQARKHKTEPLGSL